MLQSSSYIAGQWRQPLLVFVMPNLLDNFLTLKHQDVTFTNVWNLIDTTEQTSEIIRFLKKFLKSLDVKELCTFLRFTTGEI